MWKLPEYNQQALLSSGLDLTDRHATIYQTLRWISSAAWTTRITYDGVTYFRTTAKYVNSQLPCFKLKDRQMQKYLNKLGSEEVIKIHPDTGKLAGFYFTFGKNWDLLENRFSNPEEPPKPRTKGRGLESDPALKQQGNPALKDGDPALKDGVLPLDSLLVDISITDNLTESNRIDQKPKSTKQSAVEVFCAKNPSLDNKKCLKLGKWLLTQGITIQQLKKMFVNMNELKATEAETRLYHEVKLKLIKNPAAFLYNWFRQEYPPELEFNPTTPPTLFES